MSPRSSLLALVSLSVTSLLPLSARAEGPATAAVEVDSGPPMEFTLEVKGKSMPVVPGKPFDVDVGGTKVSMKLVARPERLFERDGIRFRYTATYSYQADRSDPSVSLFTLSGNDNVLIVAHFKSKMLTNEASAAMLAIFVERYGAANVRKSPATIKLGSREVKGTRLDVKLAEVHLRQDVFAFDDGAGAPVVLIVQDTPADDGSTTPETKRAVELLKTTFELAAPK